MPTSPVFQTFAERQAQQIANFEQSEWHFFRSDSTSVYLYDKYPSFYSSWQTSSISAVFTRSVGTGFAATCLGAVMTTITMGTTLFTPLIIGALIGAGISMIMGKVGAVLAHNYTAKNELHQNCIREQIVRITEKTEDSNLTQEAIEELQGFSKTPQISKKDILARIKMYDDTTQREVIRIILEDKKHRTILGERFWRKEGIFACGIFAYANNKPPCSYAKEIQESATLRELNDMFEKLGGNINSNEEKSADEAISRFVSGWGLGRSMA